MKIIKKSYICKMKTPMKKIQNLVAMKRVFVLMLFVIAPFFSGRAQINGIDDFITQIQELRTLSQKMGKYYILQNLYPSNEKYKKQAQESMDSFNSILVELIEQAPSDELQMELQKLNLTWIYVGKVLKTKYDRAAAAKVLDKLEYLQNEAKNIGDMATGLTKKDIAKVILTAAEARVMLQRMNLYFIAHRARILNQNIEQRFTESMNNLKNEIQFLENWEGNNDTTNMLLNMIKERFRSFGKNISLKSKVSPLTADMVAENMDEDLKLLVKTLKENAQ